MVVLNGKRLNRVVGYTQRAVIALILVFSLFIGSGSAFAVNVIDNFTTRPAALDPNASGAFTTGTATEGLSYSGSPADLFAWSGSGEVDCDAISDSGSGSFTITSRDGKAFVFNSIQWKNDAGAVTVTGSGPEPFTFDIPAGAAEETYTPTEGSRLVTEVEFTSSDMWALMDDVNVDFEVSRMDVQGNGITIANGDNSPDTADDTDFDSTDVGTPVTKTFTIRSYGVVNLDLTGSPYVDLSSNPSNDFSVTTQPTTDPIASGSSTTFTVQCNPSAAGARTATVSIANDSGVDPYTFDVRCTGTVVPAPEIDVEGNSTSITDGDATPESGDHTHFGNVAVGSSLDRTFTIQNEGTATLNLTATPDVAISGSGDFTVLTQPSASSIASGAAALPFVVRCTASATGDRTATVSIANDDANEATYTFTVKATGTAPEIDVEGNATSIPDGDTTPIVGDHTDFGNVAVASTFDRTFSIENEGTATLDLTGTPDVAISGSGDFSVLTQPASSSIASGGANLTFVVRCTPSSAGARTATISIANNDSNEGTYTFAVKATGITPEMDVEGNGTSIPDGDTTPSGSDHTDFGNIPAGTSVDRTFSIQNEGVATLNLTGTPDVAISGSGNFSVLTQPATSSIDSGGAALTFVVHCTPSSAGARTATLSIANNDPNEAPYTFDVKATGTVPEMDVAGSGVSIVDGEATPSTTQDTNFGDVLVASGTNANTFTITNTGLAPLDLAIGTPRVVINGEHSSDFALGPDATTPVASGGGTTTFTITFDPSAAGQRNATVSIDNNDPNEDPYDFLIQGTGIAPEMDVQGNSQSIADGHTTPEIIDDTEFGDLDIAAAPITHTFTIANTGSADLKLTGIAPNYVAVNHAAFTITNQPTTPIASAGTTTFDVSFDPSVIGAVTAIVSIANNDANENPYTFTVRGTGAATPEMDIQGNDLSIVDGDVTPVIDDHTDFGNANTTAETITRTFTVENTGSATLNLTGAVPYVTIGGTHAQDFSVTSNPLDIVAAGGGTTTFDITFDPSQGGVREATVTLANDDANENPYNFAIQGTGLLPGSSGPPVTSAAATATTGSATGVSQNSATLNGTVDAGNDSTQVTFQYGAESGNAPSGIDDVYSHTVTAAESPVSGTNITAVSAFVDGLLMNTMYHFRVVASNAHGTIYGEDMTFTTDALALGDLNGDNVIDLFDIRLCTQISTGNRTATPEERIQADIDEDMDVDMDDVIALSEYVLGIREDLP
jgi:HYDIN/CFA65/VesB-like, Ig-like domain